MGNGKRGKGFIILILPAIASEIYVSENLLRASYVPGSNPWLCGLTHLDHAAIV